MYRRNNGGMGLHNGDSGLGVNGSDDQDHQTAGDLMMPPPPPSRGNTNSGGEYSTCGGETPLHEHLIPSKESY